MLHLKKYINAILFQMKSSKKLLCFSVTLYHFIFLASFQVYSVKNVRDYFLISLLIQTQEGVLRKYLYGDAQSRLQNVDHLYTCVLQKNTQSLYLTCMTKPTHLCTFFTEMTHHHFHQQNSPLLYHHRNKGSLIYLEQFQNHPIGITILMKMHLKTFEHPRTPCFREYPPGYSDVSYSHTCLI